MPREYRLVGGVTGLVLLLWVGLSWGAPPDNTATGVGALPNTTLPPVTSPFNTATGAGALQSNTTGNANTATGAGVLLSNTTGYDNTASGVAALQNNTTGFSNTASGFEALRQNTTGDGNTASGFEALLNSTGRGNIAVGFEAGATLTNGDNNIYLGNQGQATESGIIRVGTPGTHTSTFLAGNVFASSFTPSDARLKTNITPLTNMLEKLAPLRGVSFEWNEAAVPLTGHTPGQRDLGVIAQEVEAVFPELVTS